MKEMQAGLRAQPSLRGAEGDAAGASRHPHASTENTEEVQVPVQGGFAAKRQSAVSGEAASRTCFADCR